MSFQGNLAREFNIFEGSECKIHMYVQKELYVEVSVRIIPSFFKEKKKKEKEKKITAY